MLIEDVHFRRDTHGAGDVGWKALARGLSDIAAMGGEPRFCLLSLAVAPWVETPWLDGFYGGLLRLAARTRSPLMGGDLAHAEKTMCDIVVCGAAPRGTALRRDDTCWTTSTVCCTRPVTTSADGMPSSAWSASDSRRRLPVPTR